tara:strand:- start:1147 stop:1344 length:198 start_codon:yes stop_codon:yes gene_type:complete
MVLLKNIMMPRFYKIQSKNYRYNLNQNDRNKVNIIILVFGLILLIILYSLDNNLFSIKNENNITK